MRRFSIPLTFAAVAMAAVVAVPGIAVARTVAASAAPRASALPFIRVTPPPGLLRELGTSAPILGTNWAGYAAATNVSTPANSSVSDVSGTWVVPTVTGGGTGNAYCADWIGIDGFTSTSVEQLGTEEDWIGGAPSYSAWWEMYPAAENPISTMTISPGDTMSAEVRWTSGNAFLLTMTDVTTGASFSAAQTLSQTALRSSAEWIHEAPSTRRGVLPLAQTTRCVFSNCDTTINGTNGPIGDALWQDADMWMVSSSDSADVLAQTTTLTAGGTSFVVGPPVTTTYTLSYTAGANGSIVGSSTQVVSSGGSGTAVTAVANSGYHFVNWSDGSTANPRTDTNVTANVSVTANFAVNGKTPTSLTIASSTTSVTVGTRFTLSGSMTPSPATIGLIVHVEVKKPGKGYFSYSSNRLVYAGAGGKASWQYKYNSLSTQAKGVYVFHVVFGGNGTYLPVTSRNLNVTFK